MARGSLIPYPKWLKAFRKSQQWPEQVHLVGVLWLDAVKLEETESRTECTPILAFTPGVVLEATESHIVLGHEIFSDGDNRGKTGIPAEMIRGVLKLGSTPPIKPDAP